MQLKLYFRSSHRPFAAPENAGVDEAEWLLRALQDRGVPVERLDTAAMPEAERETAYFGAAAVAVRSQVRVPRVIGSNRASATAFFGREVTALLVYERDGAVPVDIVPYEKAGRLTTIRDYLAGLSLAVNVGESAGELRSRLQ